MKRYHSFLLGVAILLGLMNGLAAAKVPPSEDSLIQLNEAAASHNIVTSTIYRKGGQLFVYAGGDGKFLDVFQLDPKLGLTPVQQQALNGNKGPGRGLVAANVEGSDFLFAGNKGGNAVEVFRIQDDGKLERVFHVEDTPETHLGVVITLRVVRIEKNSYLFVGGLELEAPGLTCFRIEKDGSLVHVQSLRDNNEIHTDGIIGMFHHTINGNTFLFTGGFQDNGVSSFRIHEDGTFENVSNVHDNHTDRYLTGAYPIDGVTLGGNHYVIVGHRHHRYYGEGYVPDFIKKKDFVYHGDGVSVFKVGDDGVLVPHYVLVDDEATKLVGQTRIEIFKLNEDEALVAVGTREDQGIQLCRLGRDGILKASGFASTGFPIYYGMSSYRVDNDLFLVAGSNDNDLKKLFSYKVALGKPNGGTDQPGVLRHIVNLKYSEGATEAQIADAVKRFAGLKSEIPEVLSLEWGVNSSTEGHSKGFTHCFTLTFADEKSLAIYLPHPAHLALVEQVKPLLSDVLVVDYWAKQH